MARLRAAYSGDLAFIHDRGFSELARAAAGVLARRLRRGFRGGGLVVDVGCGSGALASPVIDAGFDVLGIDLSASMLRLARIREPRATYRRVSFTRARLPECVAIVAAGETLSYLFDRRNGAPALRSFLRKAHDAVRPGGVLLFDVLVGPAPPDNRRGWREAGDGSWAVLFDVREAAGTGIVTRTIMSFRRKGRHFRRTVEIHRQRRFDRRELASWLEAAGFDAREIRGYGPMRFREGQAGFIATRRG